MKVVPGPRWAWGGGSQGVCQDHAGKMGSGGGTWLNAQGHLVAWQCGCKQDTLHVQPLLGKAWSVGLWSTHGALWPQAAARLPVPTLHPGPLEPSSAPTSSVT